MPIRYPLRQSALGPEGRYCRPLFGDHEPKANPGETHRTQSAERCVPTEMNDDPNDHRCDDTGAEGRTAGDHARGECAALIPKPLVHGMHRHRESRSLGRAENDATAHQHGETRHDAPRQQCRGPNDTHHAHDDLGTEPVGEKSDRRTGGRKEQEECAAQQAELSMTQVQFLHDRYAGEPDDRLVREVDQHEKKHQSNHSPGLLG